MGPVPSVPPALIRRPDTPQLEIPAIGLSIASSGFSFPWQVLLQGVPCSDPAASAQTGLAKAWAGPEQWSPREAGYRRDAGRREEMRGGMSQRQTCQSFQWSSALLEHDGQLGIFLPSPPTSPGSSPAGKLDSSEG